MINDPRTYWESQDFASPYQMGPQKHRVYLLDLLKKEGVASLLDVGCGTGPLYEMIKTTWETSDDGLAELKKWTFGYKGSDYSRTMIQTCKMLFPEGNFEVQDARKLPEETNSFDAVVLMHALDHLDDYEAAIREAARVAKKFVCIILWRGFVGEGVHLNDRNMMGKQEGEQPWEDTYLQEYSRKSLEDAFAKSNLTVVHEADGEDLNGDYSHYNWLVLLRKNEQ